MTRNTLTPPTSTGTGRPACRTAAQLLAQTRSLVEPAYRDAVDVLPAEIRHIAGYHVGWWDVDGRLAGGQGKMLRPALTLLSARAAAPESFPSSGRPVAAVVRAGVAVELAHDFSLLHDDVMDGDLTRRHRPTAWAVFGTSQAILVGDVLLIAAVQELATGLDGPAAEAAVRVLAAAVQELCAGQSADLAFEERDEVSLDECLAMAETKTGALLGAACQLGALAAGATQEVAEGYREFGRQLGLAFQLVDDLLGIWGEEAVTGKPVGSDLSSRKKSLPVVAALCSGTPAGEHLAWLYGRDEQLDEAALRHASRLVEQAGGKAWAHAEAERRTAAALTALHRMDPDPDAAADLETLAALITRRDH